MFNNATFEVSVGYNDLNTEDPIMAKSIRFLELHSILAPKSRTTLIPFLLGHNADNAGLSILFIIFKFNLAITNNAPVFPAEITISALLFFTLSIASHMLVFFPLLAAPRGVSVSSTISLV